MMADIAIIAAGAAGSAKRRGCAVTEGSEGLMVIRRLPQGRAGLVRVAGRVRGSEMPGTAKASRRASYRARSWTSLDDYAGLGAGFGVGRPTLFVGPGCRCCAMPNFGSLVGFGIFAPLGGAFATWWTIEFFSLFKS